VKLVINEPNSKEAQKTVQSFLKKRFSLFTVDIALAESLNAIWKHTNIHKDLDLHDAKSAVRDLIEMHSKMQILTTGELAEKTATIAQSQDLTVYDALYVAATQKLKAVLLTSDKKLYTAVAKITKVRLLKP
jgi:predicted nucleic acid-binding protein